MPEPNEDADGRQAFLAALGVRRRAIIGFGVGAMVASAVFVVFIVLPGTDPVSLRYLVLAGVLALSCGLLITGGLVVVRLVRLVRQPDRYLAFED